MATIQQLRSLGQSLWLDQISRDLLDSGRLAKLGWRASTTLEDGLKLAYQAYLNESRQAAE